MKHDRGTLLSSAVFALALGAVATAAVAAEGGRGMRQGPDLERIFGEFDADGDGRITRAEFDARRDSRFADADADGDGLLSADELVARAQSRAAARVAAMIARLDADGDGMLAADELPQPRRAAGRMFERLDADEDGIVTLAEAETAIEDWRGRHGGKRRPAE